jgi:hypothetical protein
MAPSPNGPRLDLWTPTKGPAPGFDATRPRVCSTATGRVAMTRSHASSADPRGKQDACMQGDWNNMQATARTHCDVDRAGEAPSLDAKETWEMQHCRRVQSPIPATLGPSQYTTCQACTQSSRTHTNCAGTTSRSAGTVRTGQQHINPLSRFEQQSTIQQQRTTQHHRNAAPISSNQPQPQRPQEIQSSKCVKTNTCTILRIRNRQQKPRGTRATTTTTTRPAAL